MLFLLRTAVPSARRCSARLIGFAKRSGFRLASLALRWAGSLTAPLASHRRVFGALVFRPAYWLRQTLGLQARFARPTSSHRRAFSASVFRPAYWLRQTLGLQARFARPTSSHRRAFGALVFRPAYWLRQTLVLQAHFARPTVGGKPNGSPYFAPPCLRRVGVPPGLLASPNAQASGSLRSPYVFAPSRLWRVGQTGSLADQSCISFIQAKSCGVMSG